MSLWIHFLLCLGAVSGFCVIFKVPKKAIVPAMIIGALGWVMYKYAVGLDFAPPLACLLGALVVALLSEAAARIFKDATTIFILPGILPLVPGAGMYYTMRELLNGDYDAMMEVGAETLLMAGAIAVAILMVTSVFRMVQVLRAERRARIAQKS